jgi:hypothetical protein
MKADHGSYAILPAERDSNHMVPLSPFSMFRRSPGAAMPVILVELGYTRPRSTIFGKEGSFDARAARGD